MARMRRNTQVLADQTARGREQRLHPSWQTVGAGDRVRVAFPDGRSVLGRLDAMTGDFRVVWVVADGDHRRMLYPEDGLTVGLA